ncbi:uncharacterized protein LOC126902573 [Daktulosphaira vitifoliae]|uniref:uncharacterized protein LOC126902573 n=1 Tax=Daktulosphaira vitifoliae TaxID=58002 RepID=UPI0021AA39E7|nr:uncharacterized protein LOC126902573 [Daktulosphaira vitifoliae]XP_050535928.1 uncharacterized protein LOC126902573 [Daktulosphaira vitifoliae]
MGGSASKTRTLEIDNPNVINLSDKVVERLRGQAEVVNSVTHNVPTYHVKPSTLEVQKSVQEALEENDKRWQCRFHHVQDEQNALSRKVENEYKRTYASVKQLLPDIGNGEINQSIQEKEKSLISCLAENKGYPLNCSEIVKEYKKTLFQSVNSQKL